MMAGPQGPDGSWISSHRSALGLVAAVVGVVVGFAAVAFHYMIQGWTWLMTGTPDPTIDPGAPHGVTGWPAWYVVAVPVVSALLYGPLVQRFAPSARGHGIPEVMLALRRKGGRIPGRIAVVKLVASALTIGGGGSAGREGPIVQVGASLGSAIAQRLGMPERRLILLASCGGAAGIAATFNAPLAGAVFALEVLLAHFSAEAFGYVVISSVASSIVSRWALGSGPLVDLHVSFGISSLTDMGWVALLGFIAGLIGVGFSKVLYLVEDVMDALWRLIGLPEALRPAVLGIVLGCGLLLFPQMYGSGYPIQWQALDGQYTVPFLLLLMLARIIYTSWTIGMGGSGGVFAPTLFIGAMAGMAFGQIVDPLTQSPLAVYGVIGMGAAFAGAARAPLTGVIIIVEMTGQYDLILPMMLAVVLATAVSRFLTRSTIYTEKLRRRGDSLSDPLGATLLGSRTAAELMGPMPAPLDPDMSVRDAALALGTRLVDEAPVQRADGTFVGVVRSGRIAEALARGQDGLVVADLCSTVPALRPDAPATEVTRALASLDGARGIPVLDEGDDGRIVGWIGLESLPRRASDQQCAILRRHTEDTSWGSRWQARHGRAPR